MTCLFIAWKRTLLLFLAIQVGPITHSLWEEENTVFFLAGLKHLIFSCQSRNHYSKKSYDKFSVFIGAHRNEMQNMYVLSVAQNLKRIAKNFYVRPYICVYKIHCLSST
jgi:hypothetical protein